MTPQAFWFLPTANVWRVDYEHLENATTSVLLNIDQTPDAMVKAFDGPPVYSQMELPALGPNRRMGLDAQFWSGILATRLRQYVTPGTYASRRAYISATESTSTEAAALAPTEQ
jgi:hypothetical protein